MKKLLFTLLTLTLAAPNYAQDLTAVSPEGVEIYFMILDENDKTCATIEDEAIDKSTVGKVTIPDEVEGYAVVGIASYSFEDCEDVTEVVLPHYLQWIDERAFWGTGIEQVTIGDVDGSYTEMPLEIYDQAFGNCPNLTKITVGQNVTYFPTNAFTWSNILEFNSYITDPFGFSAFTPNPDATLYVPAGTKEVYENTAGWSSFPNIVEMGGATAIQDVNGTKAVTSVKYHNLAGMVSDRPFDGVNIVTTTHADGTTTTQKILK